MPPARIIHVIKNLPFDGGTTHYLYQLLSHLDRSIYEPHILVIEREPPGRSFTPSFEAIGVPVTLLPTDSFAPSILGGMGGRAITAWLARQRPALIQTHLARAHIYGGLAALRLGCPAVMTEHGIVRNTTLPVRLWDNIYGRAVKRIVCNSHATRRQVAHDIPLLPRRRLAVIYPGVHDYPANNDPGQPTRADLGFGPDDQLLAYVGTFMPVRRHDLLLQAFAALHPVEPHARLLLIGDGPTQAQVRQQVHDLGLERVVFIWNARHDVRALLPLLDGYVNPASGEAFGLATVEAMLAGLPIVVNACGALPELIEHEVSGLHAAANDPISLAAALRRLLNDPGRAQAWGQAARCRARQQFTPHAFARAYESLYASILSSKSPRPRAAPATSSLSQPGQQVETALPSGAASATQRARPRLLIAGPTPPPFAGVETFTQTVVMSPLIQERFALAFCNMRKPITNEQRGRLGLVNIRYNLAHLWQLRQLSRRLRPQLAYLPLSQNRPGFFRDSMLLWMCRPFSERIVFQVHGGAFDHFYRAQPAWFQAYVRAVFRRADAFLIGGERLRQQFQGLVASEKFHAAAYGVHTLYPPRRRPSDDDLLTIRVLFMGHISFAKGAVDLVRAIPLILPHLRVKLMVQMAGEFIRKERNITFIPEHDNAPEAIERTVREHHLEGIVTFLGVIRDEQKLQTLVDSDIFVLPSYTEAIGLSVMEAMAARLPVVVTAAGALPDMLTEGVHCLFVQPGDPEGLARQLLRLIEDRSLRQRMGEANRRIIEERYNETAFLNRLAGALDTVLSG